MSSTKNYVNTVHIGSGTNSGATTLATITKGDLFLVNAKTMEVLNGTTVAALSANDTVYIASGVGKTGEFKLSEAFSGKTIVTHFGGTTYAAPVKQRTYVGYNEVATAGELPVADETEYSLNIVIKDDQRPHGQKQTRELYHFTTGIGATQADAAFGIASLFGVRSLNGNYKQYNGRFVDLEVVGDAASQGVSDNAVAVVKGSKRITYTTAAEYNTGTPIAVGNYVTFDNADGTIGHYLVAAVDGLIVTLDQPYAGETRTVAAGDSDYYTQTQADAADYGFRLTSQEVEWNGIDTYEIVAFDSAYIQTNDTDVASTATQAVVATTAQAFMGAGYWQQVYDMEYFAAGYMGVNSRTRWYDAAALNPAALTDTTGATTYNIVSITGKKQYNTDFQNTGTFPVSAQIAVPKLNTPTAVGTQEHDAVAANTLNFVGILNQFFATIKGFDVIDF